MGDNGESSHLQRAPCIAIDLGTSSCSVGVWLDGRVQIIPNENGKLSTPSYVAFTDTQRLVGEQAQKQALRKPENVFFEVKRLIGRRWKDISDEWVKSWPFSVGKAQDSGELGLRVTSAFLEPFLQRTDRLLTPQQTDGARNGSHPTGDGKTVGFLAPEEITAMLLAKMKACAESQLSCGKLEQAVITVPTYFDDHQKDATKVAAEIAGFNGVRLVHEPTAAAIAYAQHMGLLSLAGPREGSSIRSGRKSAKETTIMVFALGGGCLDVALVIISEGRVGVRVADGDSKLGGADFDNVIVEIIEEQAKGTFGGKVDTSSPRLRRKMKAASEKAKQDLTLLREATIEIDSVRGDDDLSFVLTREEFVSSSEHLFRRCTEVVQQVFLKAEKLGITKEAIDEMVLVGGSTRIPELRERLHKAFGKVPRPHSHQNEAVVHGAALYTVCAREIIEEIDPTLAVSSEGDETPASLPTTTEDSRGDMRSLLDTFKERAKLIEEYEEDALKLSEARFRSEKFVGEALKRSAEYPPWVRRIIEGEIRCTTEGMDGAMSLEELNSQYKQMADLCEYAFGAMWSKSFSRRKFFIADRWIGCDCEPPDVCDPTQTGLGNLSKASGSLVGPDLCDLVVAPPVKELLKTKRSIEGLVDGGRIEIAAPGGVHPIDNETSASRVADARRTGRRLPLTGPGAPPQVRYKVSAESLRNRGILYTIIGRGPSGWSEDIPQQVAAALRTGLRVILCVGGEEEQEASADGKQLSHSAGGAIGTAGGAVLGSTLAREREKCKEQLEQVLREVGKTWRNVVVAYQPSWESQFEGETSISVEEFMTAVVDGHVGIRETLRKNANRDVAESTRIIFGTYPLDRIGTIWDALSRQKEIDGFLLDSGFRRSEIVHKILRRRWKAEESFLLLGVPETQEDVETGNLLSLLDKGGANLLGCGDEYTHQPWWCSLVAFPTTIDKKHWVRPDHVPIFDKHDLIATMNKLSRPDPAPSPSASPPSAPHLSPRTPEPPPGTPRALFDLVSRTCPEQDTYSFPLEGRVIINLRERDKDRKKRPTADTIAAWMAELDKIIRGDEWRRFVIAYTPEWATGSDSEVRPDPEAKLYQDVEGAHSEIRSLIARNKNYATADQVAIVCEIDGASSMETLRRIAVMPNVDGLMLGSSLVKKLANV
ncbi:hypothetical protein CBR_g17133 [Chara braunii]|uniref:Uncharacterized protein n=1 Tax=Chara braunii TaxID=69332 RepID=A0A388KUQ6_CHABU|nr:hypothetical protein CBR_g17133 [Chara braunii]|eukprot:GBG73794.1 hypothetical protein CBR_g17133 [Chara braunii]